MLQPPEATAAEDLCSCAASQPWKLMAALSYNPIACLHCNREIPVERLHLPEPVLEQVAAWRSVYDALDRLWLASGPYEAYAAAQLGDLTTPVNIQGRAVVGSIGLHHTTYYWWSTFPLEDIAPVALTACPLCAGLFTIFNDTVPPQVVCHTCRLVAALPEPPSQPNPGMQRTRYARR